LAFTSPLRNEGFGDHGTDQREKPLLSFVHHDWLALWLSSTSKENTALNGEETKNSIAELRLAYDAFNRGDIDSAVRFLDPEVEWTEPPDFPGGGTYHGIEGARGIWLNPGQALPE
jgi:hypothetical protein